MSPSSSKLKDKQKDFKQNYNDQKIQYRDYSRKFIIVKNIIKNRLPKLILVKNFQRDHSQNFISKISRFFSLAKVSSTKVVVFEEIVTS